MNVTLEQAYGEAVKALGEATVRERLLTAEVQRLTAENEALGQAQQPQRVHAGTLADPDPAQHGEARVAHA